MLIVFLILAILLGVNILFHKLYFSVLKLPPEMEIKILWFFLLILIISYLLKMFLFIYLLRIHIMSALKFLSVS